MARLTDNCQSHFQLDSSLTGRARETTPGDMHPAATIHTSELRSSLQTHPEHCTRQQHPTQHPPGIYSQLASTGPTDIDHNVDTISEGLGVILALCYIGGLPVDLEGLPESDLDLQIPEFQISPDLLSRRPHPSDLFYIPIYNQQCLIWRQFQQLQRGTHSWTARGRGCTAGKTTELL
ncbi:hypothetical protein PTTG_26135 [Puccinia triticina 1-1 BBBD Race 1]|uniref:Uncharacterized protein n=1 Tax=Puccinia triticina (isolate 1-1 / race 1 (BBBD)) TaxID=630390 RepID=A0A180GXG2_PUCT1|nr:hypothetical protein PTTG_26135 [Puccinia triticina 1-1 BBBD Race 1]